MSDRVREALGSCLWVLNNRHNAGTPQFEEYAQAAEADARAALSTEPAPSEARTRAENIRKTVERNLAGKFSPAAARAVEEVVAELIVEHEASTPSEAGEAGLELARVRSEQEGRDDG